MTKAQFKDHFSALAHNYSQFRPTYPPDLFQELATLTPKHDHAWDVGCGNGQASMGLAQHFNHVTATDASAQQIEAAKPHPKISFHTAPAEASPLPQSSVDFIQIAQALHWFDFEPFYNEVRRVARPHAVIAAFSYEVFQTSPDIDTLIAHYYDDVVGPYWPRERAYIQAGYRTIPFPFHDITPPRIQNMEADWTLEQLVGYLSSWSATKRYIEDQDHDPIPELKDRLRAVWPSLDGTQRFTWPLAFRIGRVHA